MPKIIHLPATMGALRIAPSTSISQSRRPLFAARQIRAELELGPLSRPTPGAREPLSPPPSSPLPAKAVNTAPRRCWMLASAPELGGVDESYVSSDCLNRQACRRARMARPSRKNRAVPPRTRLYGLWKPRINSRSESNIISGIK